jgi:hypothetical protein
MAWKGKGVATNKNGLGKLDLKNSKTQLNEIG